MSDLTRLTIAEARAALAKREMSAVELTDAYLSAIDAANGEMNAYISVTADKALTRQVRSRDGPCPPCS